MLFAAFLQMFTATFPITILKGSVGSSFGVTLLTLIYGGSNSPRSFAFAFGAGGVLAVGTVAASLAMQRRHTS